MSRFGRVLNCDVKRDRATGRGRGFAFVTYEDPRVGDAVCRFTPLLEVDGKRVDIKIKR
jgi:RNA recognition motif-containing protein